jgi:hypothetical protein
MPLVPLLMLRQSGHQDIGHKAHIDALQPAHEALSILPQDGVMHFDKHTDAHTAVAADINAAASQRRHQL